VARTIPCLDLRFPPLDAHPDLPDTVTLAIEALSPAAVHETGPDDRPCWRVFLTDPRHVDQSARDLIARFGSVGLDVVIATVADEDWAARSQAHLTRVTVGRVTIAPPWDAAPPADGVLVVVLPSTGFGTGHHQTTRLCLQLLQDTPVSQRRVVDLGTGSGVLALAAWRLDAAEVEAIDYDADAIANAAENLQLNSAPGAVTLRQADLAIDIVAPADVVTANLTGALLCRQASTITALVRPGGTLIVSGILNDELAAVREAFASSLALIDEIGEDEWRAMRWSRG
jgi:ribosomal protein L11 methyltransferase